MNWKSGKRQPEPEEDEAVVVVVTEAELEAGATEEVVVTEAELEETVVDETVEDTDEPVDNDENHVEGLALRKDSEAPRAGSNSARQ